MQHKERLNFFTPRDSKYKMYLKTTKVDFARYVFTQMQNVIGEILSTKVIIFKSCNFQKM